MSQPLDLLTNEYPIYKAVENGNISEVRQQIMKYPSDINKPNKDGVCPLHLCVSKGSVEIARLLIENGADINIVDGPLQLTAIKKYAYNSMLRGAEMDITDRKLGISPLHYACFHGHLDVVKLLIEKGVKIDPCDRSKKTPLFCAVNQGHFEIANILLENGAKINAQDINGDSPLLHAMKSEDSNMETFQILIDYGSSYRIQDRNGKSVLDECKSHPKGEDIVNCIIKKMTKMKLIEAEKDPKPLQLTLDDCVICDDQRKEIFSLLPCGHAKTCEICCLKLIASSNINSVCPICRSKIDDFKKIYF